MVLYSAQRARRSLFSTIRFRVVSQVATVLSYVVLIRSMEEEAFGIYNLLYSFIPVIATLTSLGLEQTLRRFQPEYLQTGQGSAAAWLVRVVATTRFAASLIAIGLLLLAWNIIAPHFELQAYRADFAIFGILIVLYFQSAILQYSLASHMLHQFSVGSMAALAAGKLGAYLAFSYFGELTVRTAIVADITAYGLAYVLLCVAYLRFAAAQALARAHRPEPAERQRLKRYAVFNHFNDAASLLVYGQTDNFFVGGMIGPVAVAAYAFYARLTEMINNLIPVTLFESVVQPLLFAVRRDEASARIPRYFSLLLDINFVLQLPAIAFTAVYHREIVGLVFGDRYLSESALFPLVVTMAAIPNVLAIPVTLMAQYYERASTILVSEVFGLYQIAAMLILVPAFGLYGAALSTGSFHLLRNLFVWWRLRDRVRWMNARAVLAMSVLVWGAVIAVCLLLRRFTALPPIVDLIMGAVLCGMGVLVYVRTPAISQSDREILANVLHGREGRLLRWFGVLPRGDRLSTRSQTAGD
jgi:O-antigen/teichoic acid export membrane protein